MPIDKETQIMATTILTKEVQKELKEISKKYKRSVSSQIAVYIEKCLKEENEILNLSHVVNINNPIINNTASKKDIENFTLRNLQ